MTTHYTVPDALTGVIAVLISPYTQDGAVDESATEQIAHRVDAAGVHAITSLGNTAEVHQLTIPEQRAHLRGVAAAREHSMIIAGAAGAAANVLDQIEFAAGLGFDAAMVHEPPDPFGDDGGFAAYYRSIADRTALPIVAYLRSGRVGIDAITAMVQHPSIVGVKYATRDLGPLRTVMQRVPDACIWVNGAAEGRAPDFLPLGITGFTSGIANARPDLALAVHAALVSGDETQLGRLVNLLAPIEAVRAESRNKFNVSVLKAMMASIGINVGAVRPPHCELTADASARLARAVKGLPPAAPDA